MFTRVKPLGWAFLEILTSTQMNQLDTNVSRAIDGLNGGAYTLAVMLELKGAGVKFSSVAQFAAAATSFTGVGTVTVGADTTWTFNNPVLFNALATFAGSMTVPAGQSLTIQDAAALFIAATGAVVNDGGIQNNNTIFNDHLIINRADGRLRRRSMPLPSTDPFHVEIANAEIFYMPNTGAACHYYLDDTAAADEDEVEFRQFEVHAAPGGHQVTLNGVNTFTFGTQAGPGDIKALRTRRIAGVWRHWLERYG